MKINCKKKQGTSSTQESLSELSSAENSANRKQSSSEEEPQPGIKCRITTV